jgi:hypothetical protein
LPDLPATHPLPPSRNIFVESFGGLAALHQTGKARSDI